MAADFSIEISWVGEPNAADISGHIQLRYSTLYSLFPSVLEDRGKGGTDETKIRSSLTLSSPTIKEGVDWVKRIKLIVQEKGPAESIIVKINHSTMEDLLVSFDERLEEVKGEIKKVKEEERKAEEKRKRILEGVFEVLELAREKTEKSFFTPKKVLHVRFNELLDRLEKL